MKGLNLVMLMGNLGVNPELRYTSTGTPVANFTMATSEEWKDAQGAKQERTEWHNIRVWGPLAVASINYLKKGSRILITRGKNRTESWDDQNNMKRYKTVVEVQEMTFLDPAPQGQETHQPQTTPDGANVPPPPAQTPATPPAPTTTPIPPPPATHVPPPPPAPPAGPTYEQLKQAGWSDEQLLADSRFAHLVPAKTNYDDAGFGGL